MEIIFAILLGLAAVWAAFNALQLSRVSGRDAAGYAIAALSAIVQVLNITGRLGGEYSLIVSIITTIGLIGGFAMARNAPTTGTRT